MTNQTSKLQPDTIINNYWGNNEQFADLFNAVLFQGRQVIKATELRDMDTNISSVIQHKKHIESMKGYRDKIKVAEKISSTSGIHLVLLGLENQTRIHYAMPMRTMGYDYASYKRQYDINATKYPKGNGLEGDEFLSKMKKTDKFAPIITVVIYYGKKPWDGAKSLHEMLDIPEEMVPYVNDYKMLLVEARENNLTLHNMNNRDLFNLLQIILDNQLSPREIREKAIQYDEEHNADASVVMAVAAATEAKIDYDAVEKEGATMQSVYKELEDEGIAKGIIQILIKQNKSDNEILNELMSTMNISQNTAMEYLNNYNKNLL